MAGELKREPRPTDDALPRARPPHRPARADATPVVEGAHWFGASDPSERTSRSGAALLATPLFIAALVVVAVVRSALVRVLLPMALALAAVMVLLRVRRSAPPKRASRRGLSLGPDRLDFHAGGAPQTVLFTDAPFGVTLLANGRRESLIALLSSASGTFAVGAAFDPSTRESIARLLGAASTSTDELDEAPIAPDGEPLALSANHFAELVAALERRSSRCLDRVVLSDARGSAITLDGARLEVGDRVVDLEAPLEWRSLVFQESFGPAVAVYQGTWVRQAAIEFVFVSLLPSFGASALGKDDIARLDRGALRDLRLMQAVAEQPPPSDQRIAIERLFMLPLRAALDKAPSVESRPSRAQA